MNTLIQPSALPGRAWVTLFVLRGAHLREPVSDRPFSDAQAGLDVWLSRPRGLR